VLQNNRIKALPQAPGVSWEASLRLLTGERNEMRTTRKFI